MLEEGCPIEVFAAELRRGIKEGTGDAQANLQALPSLMDEALVAEVLARSKGMWVDMSQITGLGTPFPSGVENEVYLNSHGNVIYKVNNLMTSKTLLALFDRLILHNSIFPQTGYRLKGFTGLEEGAFIRFFVRTLSLTNVKPHLSRLICICQLLVSKSFPLLPIRMEMWKSQICIPVMF